MIPIRDANPSRTFPFINIIIIVINVLMFFGELSLGAKLPQFFMLYGVVPMRYSSPEIAAHFSFTAQLIPFISSLFLHGSWLHLIGNMWFLYIFGDNVEDRMGHFKYLIFYLLSGLAASFLHLVTNWGSELPTIGASGTIAGVMGAYVLMFPQARILTLVPIFYFIQFIQIPAFFFLGIWFLIQFLSGTSHILSGQVVSGGVAWWAHIGGFIFGALAVMILGKRRARRRPNGYVEIKRWWR